MATTLQTPRKSVSGDVHLSHSQLRCYATCSLQWFLSRRYRAAHVSSALVFGGAFHKGLQVFHQGRLEGRSVDVDEMQAAYLSHWQAEKQEVRFGKNETATSLEVKAGQMFAAFVEQVEPGEVIAVEERFECHLADGLPKLVGFIDLIEIREDADGVRRLHLIDFKTAAKKPGQNVEADQLTLYAIAAHRIGLLNQFEMPFSLDFLYVTKTKTPEVIRVIVEPDRREALRLIEKARVCWQGMSQGLCFPTPSWMCGGCGHAAQCHQWPDLPPDGQVPSRRSS